MYEKMLRMIHSNQKNAFLAAFFWGILAYLYMFANKLSFYDDIAGLFDVGTTYPSGRWFLGILGENMSKLYGNYSIPMLNGIMSILFVSMAAAVIVDILRIQSAWGSIMVGGIAITFPTVMGTFAYMFTAPYYFFGLLLTVIGAWLIRQNKHILLVVVGGGICNLRAGNLSGIFSCCNCTALRYLYFGCDKRGEG